ncbi:MAG: hypothetical protein IJ660_03865 [Alphaproteobacteria bacterium]|nr:hypothetical protein [Alphaproteobacteria bacterium]
MTDTNNDVLKRMPLVDYDKTLQFMQNLEYSDIDNINYVEQQLYTQLQSNQADTDLLVLMMHQQIMKGRGQRARSIAYRIWETGGQLRLSSEQIFIKDLMNLGLSDMAGAALASYIADLENNMANYGNLLLKYAIYSGNMTLLERVLIYFPENKDKIVLQDWIQLNEDYGVTKHIPAILNRIIEKVQDSMLGFSYNLFHDRDFPDIEFIFYVDDSIKNYKETGNLLNMQISTYCAAHKIEDLINLSSVVYPISRHRSDVAEKL